jgi:hypothetical protein
MICRIVKYINSLRSKPKTAARKANHYAIEFVTMYLKLETHDWSVYHTTINFSKCNVPFRNTFIVKPIYNTHNKLIYLMSIAYKSCSPPIHILPKFSTFDQILNVIKQLSSAITLTTPSSPFIIKYVSPEWCVLSGYTSQEVIGSTFKIIQGHTVDDKDDALHLKQKILSKLSYF